MTLTDLIDETLRSIGADEKRIDEAREFATALYTGSSAEERRKLNRELSEEEVLHYKTVILLYFAAILTSPEFRDQLYKDVQEKLKRN